LLLREAVVALQFITDNMQLQAVNVNRKYAHAFD